MQLYLVCLFSVCFFFLKRRYNILRILITILILWSFAFITGLTPSVLRATLMFTFIQAGTLMKRRVNGINSVLASAFVLILIRPSVVFDAGFLLSYSAVIYIISFYQAFYNKIAIQNMLGDKIWQSAVITILHKLLLFLLRSCSLTGFSILHNYKYSHSPAGITVNNNRLPGTIIIPCAIHIIICCKNSKYTGRIN